MSYRIRSVTKNQPCPICGKPDWCGFKPQDGGGEMVICQRDVEKQNTIGHDGKFYVYVTSSEAGNSIFEEAVQRQVRQNAWKRQNGYENKKNNDNKALSFKQASFQSAPKEIDKIHPKSNEELDVIYRELLNMLVLDDIHYQSLKKEGWSDELIQRHHIVSIPEKDFIRFKYKNNYSKNKFRKTLAANLKVKFGEDCLIGVPGAYKDANGNWTFAGPKGILLPQYDANGYIYRLRIRMDFMDINQKLQKIGDEFSYIENGITHYLVPMKGRYTIENGNKIWDKLGKYRNLSSFHQDEKSLQQGIIKNSYDEGCESGNQLSIYCNPQRDSMFLCYVIEGEKKGMYSNDRLHAPVITLPGVNSWSKMIEGKKGERAIDILKKKGVKMFVIAFDADKFVNEKVLASEKNAIRALQQEGFDIGVAYWNPLYGKGMDDMLFGGHMPQYSAV